MLPDMPLNAEFVCLALAGASVSGDVPNSTKLRDGLFVSLRCPFDLEGHWKRWLGEIQTGHLLKSNFMIVAFGLREGEGERTELSHLADLTLHSIIIQGAPAYDGALIVRGRRGVDGFHVNQVSTLLQHFYARGARPARITRDTLCDTAVLLEGFECIEEDEKQFRRLNRGVRAMIRGFREREAPDRLHEFVRALEGVVRPRISKSRSQFVHRAQAFAGRWEEVRNLLGEMYDLRSCTEHLNDWTTKLADYPEPGLTADLRSYQAEVLACHAFRRMFTSESLRAIFTNDDTMNEFWKKPDHEVSAAFGEPIDLLAIASEFPRWRNRDSKRVPSLRDGSQA